MSLSNNLSKILIIDFGSQFTQLIARRVRELGVFSEIVSHKKIKITQITKDNIAGIILSGGPLNVYENNKFKTGDTVSIIECKPFSKNKKFQVMDGIK